MFGRNKRRHGVIQTLIGDGTRVEGDVRFAGGCHIDGVVHGSVVADRDPDAFLSISEDGRVEGSVTVPQMSLNGTVEGDVYCTDRVQLGPTARVVGNLHYEVLEMAAGAEINGQLIHQADKAKTARKPHGDVDATQPMAAPVIAESEG